MNLQYLSKAIKPKKIIGRIQNVEIENITINSREKHKNSLYIAQKGKTFDGRSFVDEAIINGAVALVLDKPLEHYKFPQIIVDDTRKATALLASKFNGEPKKHLKFVGVTGTNGKTSCVLFISQILNNLGIKTASVGTLGASIGHEHFPTDLTTPDPIVFHKLLKTFVEKEVKVVVMEASAHALYLSKLEGISFEVGILTNITQDHLDFFGNMQAYAKAKTDFILSNQVKTAFVNADDPYCQKLIGKKRNILTFGLNTPSDIFAIDMHKKINGTTFVMNLLDHVLCCETSLVGDFNVSNLMAVAGTLLCFNVKPNVICKQIKNLSAPLGRFNTIDLGGGRTAIIDFAHTPDSLQKVLETAKDVCSGEIISVFGCGGDRDRLKRPIMGAISESLADFTIITSDNPRFEKPEDILSDIEKGMKTHNYFKIADRKLAIKKAIEMLKYGDVVVISGKGGELYQDINGIKLPYNDFDEVKKSF